MSDSFLLNRFVYNRFVLVSALVLFGRSWIGFPVCQR